MWPCFCPPRIPPIRPMVWRQFPQCCGHLWRFSWILYILHCLHQHQKITTKPFGYIHLVNGQTWNGIHDFVFRTLPNFDHWIRDLKYPSFMTWLKLAEIRRHWSIGKGTWYEQIDWIFNCSRYDQFWPHLVFVWTCAFWKFLCRNLWFWFEQHTTVANKKTRQNNTWSHWMMSKPEKTIIFNTPAEPPSAGFVSLAKSQLLKWRKSFVRSRGASTTSSTGVPYEFPKTMEWSWDGRHVLYVYTKMSPCISSHVHGNMFLYHMLTCMCIYVYIRTWYL